MSNDDAKKQKLREQLRLIDAAIEKGLEQDAAEWEALPKRFNVREGECIHDVDPAKNDLD